MVTLLATSDDFKEKVEKAEPEKLVVVDFFATWCGPCKMIAPKLEEMAKSEFTDVLFFKVDVDENEEVAEELEITAMPSFLFFKNGKQIPDATLMGANVDNIRAAIKKYK